MTWYRTGTIAVTNGSAAVTGSGTDFVQNVLPGEALQGPDGRTYEVLAVISATQLTLASNYLGSTASGQAYAVLPTQSFALALAQQAVALIASFSTVRDGVGQGLFADGTVATPAIRFASDQDTGIYWAGPNSIAVAGGGVVRLLVDINGNIGCGWGVPETRIDIAGSENAQFQIRSSTARWRLNVSDINGNFYLYDPDNNKFPLIVNRSTNNVQPGLDNAQTIGAASARWSTVYAATGTINTSDTREKVWRGGLTPAELAAAREISAELGFFQWIDAVEAKGDEARLHFGARAQRVWEIMAHHGLVDPIGKSGKPGRTPYAFLCWDEWPAEPARAAVLGEEGQIITPAFPAQSAGHRFGLRTDQLALFLVAAMEQRLAALEGAAA